MNTELLINNISRYISLTPEEKEQFLSYWKTKKIKRKQLLLETGEIAHYQYYVLKGCLRSYYIDSNGFEHNIQFAIEDWWISDVASFFSEKPALLNLETLEESEVMILNREKTDLLFKEIPKFERF